MIDLQDIASQLRATLLGNATIATLSSGVYYAQAPQGQGYPYVTFFDVTGVPRHTQGSGVVENMLWQIDIWGKRLTNITQIHYETLQTLDSATLALNTVTHIALVRANTLPLDREQVEEEGVIFHQPVEYQIFVR